MFGSDSVPITSLTFVCANVLDFGLFFLSSEINNFPIQPCCNLDVTLHEFSIVLLLMTMMQ